MIYVSKIMSDHREKNKMADSIDECTLKVHINDKLSKINDMYLNDGAGGFIVCQG